MIKDINEIDEIINTKKEAKLVDKLADKPVEQINCKVPCKRERVTNKSSGKINNKAVVHNEKCEKQDEICHKEKENQIPLKSSVKRSLGKKSKKSIKKRKTKSHKKSGSRRISLKRKRVTEKDIETVQKHIENIRSIKTSDIKKELENDGIKVSGKSNRLLKDIYLYSKLCGINIKHE